MAANLEKLAKEYENRGYPEFATSLMAQAVIARKLGIPENFSIAETEKSEIQRFTQEQKDALKKEGYVFYELTGQSIKTLREAGNSFWSTWHEDYPYFEVLKSMKSEVAINPKQLFLPGSNCKKFLGKEVLVENFSKNISAKIPGVEAIIGKAPDYIELAFLSPTKHCLFGKEYGYGYTITQTQVGSGVACVGGMDSSIGIDVIRWNSDNRSSGLYVAPLVVPIGNN